MFTQCSKCETVFRLSAQALRAAGGQVRCGRCGEVFNALARLAEDATGFTMGESSWELETRADEILETAPPHATPLENALTQDPPPASRPSAEPPPIEAPPGVEIAQLQLIDSPDADLIAETSLEFTLPPGDLDRVFIDDRPHPVPAPKPDPPPAAIEPPHPESAHPEQSTRISGLEVSEDVQRDLMSMSGRAEPPRLASPRRGLPPAAWITAGVVLLLLLVFQLVRGNGAWLAHVPYFGANAAATANLSAFQLRQWGVTGDPGASGALRVRASIMNTATQLQPYPLLRVTLVNRFGGRVGAREFKPAEYLGKPTARMLAPGERADAMLDILDPGKDAESFEIDVCIRGTDQKITCAGDAAAQTK